MDTSTGLTILGTAIGSAKIVEKLLGPTADYIGGGVKDWTERRMSNVRRIFDYAQKQLGSKLDSPGAVPPKVLRDILNDGSFCDDELTAEYFGGVLASSRTEISRDDRGSAFTALIARLTTYQIRTHFFFYQLVKLVFDGDDISVTTSEGRAKLQMFVPLNSFFVAMEFSPQEDVQVLLSHAIVGLVKESLIEENFVLGPNVHQGNAGILFQPSAVGAELFLWAYGRGDLHIANFLDPEVRFVSATKIRTVPGFKGVHKAEVSPTTAAQKDEDQTTNSGLPPS